MNARRDVAIERNHFLSRIAHPVQSLYRYFLYRHHIDIASSSLLHQLSKQWERPSHPHITEEEHKIVSEIKQKTANYNRNNITRTAAYLAFFERHPEVHWAFLAHIVSRNGGWNMTDLKGSVIPRLLPAEHIHPLFLFLERANALIFHDAYPQLLLYEKSKQKKKPLFHLLASFSVSSFMKPFWEYFFETKNSPVITVALIINEQQYIQKRVMENKFFQTHVLSTIPFIAEQWLGFNDVLIPYQAGPHIRLAGTTVRDFADVHHRIHIGKSLYSILFFQHRLAKRAYQFASQHAHTGSRADFWPQLFSAEKADPFRIYSPRLETVWPNISHPFSDRRDWFTDKTIIKMMETIPVMKEEDITANYMRNIQTLNAAVKAVQ
ncbi:DUF2515 domain-containing protein [Parageobacillus toebii]|uniref:DUF2515 domain-containing protein n=1 Tax=Parageobacillus toebii TaxID=153151 RepID=UPI0007879F41|nr:DUF2515 domain-containing protein [Parageobacillus toebii]QSB47592.1 DUF2515 domain-containing protein [Parageobacillus toebii]